MDTLNPDLDCESLIFHRYELVEDIFKAGFKNKITRQKWKKKRVENNATEKKQFEDQALAVEYSSIK